MDHRSCGELESPSQAESATRNPLGNSCDGMGKSPKSYATQRQLKEIKLFCLDFMLQTDQGKKSVTLWVVQIRKKTRGIAWWWWMTNLLNAKRRQAVKEITTEKEKKVQNLPSLFTGNPQRLVWGNARWRNGSYRATATQVPGSFWSRWWNSRKSQEIGVLV